jgi:TonB family protein
MSARIVGGRYRLERELERCGMGIMYLASDLEADGAPFAVKLIRPELRSFPEALTLLRSEVRVTRMLRHPAIARVYALHSDSIDTYLVLEYPGGQSLETLLHRTRQGLPLDEAVVVVDDLCAALAYAHELDVVHGDVQPATVHITPTGRVKLIDFGMVGAARVCGERVDALWSAGRTMAYASVEMLEGRAPDVRDDVYSLACIIYTVLSGVHPFGSHSAVEARRRGLSMAPLVALSREQNAALARALAFQRAQRTPSVIALLADLGWTPDFAAEPEPPTEATAAWAPGVGYFAPDDDYVVTEPIPAVGMSSTAPYRTEPPHPNLWARYRVPVVVGVLLVALGAGLVYREFVTPATNSAPLPEPVEAASGEVDTQTSAISDTAAATPRPAPAPPSLMTAATTASVAANPPFVPTARTPPGRPAAHAVAMAEHAPPTAHAAAAAGLRPLPRSAAAMAQNDNCPYPREAVDEGLTGTVVLSVFVTADGYPDQVKTDKTSGSQVLDEAAVRCVERFGRFSAAPGGEGSGGYWGRLRFTWSFGG